MGHAAQGQRRPGGGGEGKSVGRAVAGAERPGGSGAGAVTCRRSSAEGGRGGDGGGVTKPAREGAGRILRAEKTKICARRFSDISAASARISLGPGHAYRGEGARLPGRPA